MNYSAHTCKHSIASPVPGWEVDSPRFFEEGGGCMANEAAHWRVLARHPVLNLHTSGSGHTAAEATAKCISNIKEVYGG